MEIVNKIHHFSLHDEKHIKAQVMYDGHLTYTRYTHIFQNKTNLQNIFSDIFVCELHFPLNFEITPTIFKIPYSTFHLTTTQTRVCPCRQKNFVIRAVSRRYFFIFNSKNVYLIVKIRKITLIGPKIVKRRIFFYLINISSLENV